jgi:hypothetical protein
MLSAVALASRLLLLLCMQAKRDNASMVKDLGWLSASEAEASSLSRGLKSQVRLGGSADGGSCPRRPPALVSCCC